MGKTTKPIEKRPFKPANSVEERENQMISLAVDCAEQQLRDGTASSQVICHYLKLGSTKERLEKQVMEEHRELLRAKRDALEAAKRVEDLYAKALDAMRAYSGQVDNGGDIYDD